MHISIFGVQAEFEQALKEFDNVCAKLEHSIDRRV